MDFQTPIAPTLYNALNPFRRPRRWEFMGTLAPMVTANTL